MPPASGPPLYQQLSLARQILADPRPVIDRCTARYGRLWRSYMPGRGGLVPAYWLMGPEGSERILAAPYRDDFSWYEGYGFTMEPLLSRDILFLLDDAPGDPAGGAHRRRHRQLLPALHPRRDDEYLRAMGEIMDRRLERLPERGEVDLGAEVKQVTFEVVARLLFAAEEDELPALYHDFEELGLGLYTPLRLRLPGTRFSRGLRARRALAARLRRRLQRCRDEGAPAGTLLGALLSVGAAEGAGGAAPGSAGGAAPGSAGGAAPGTAAPEEAEAPLPEETLIGEMLAFLFAGYDTTASLLTSSLLCLGGRADVREAVAAEARALPRWSFAALADLEWLCAALLEAERLYPPLIFALRGVLRDFTFQGCEIRAGSKALYSAYYSGRLPELFPEPERFLPERFLGGRRPPPYSVLGFGGGHRACIGKRFAQLEMRLFVARLLSRFDFQPVPGQREEVFFNPTLQRRGGYRVTLRRRAP